MNKQVNVSRPSGASRYRAPEARMGRSQFDLTHSHKTTFDVGYLVPYFLLEIIPGDTVTCKLDSFIRIFSPLDAPIMDDIYCNIDFFYVPCRLVWEHFDEFLGASDAAGAQPVDYTIPIMSSGNTIAYQSAMNYMGLPVGLTTTGTAVSALPARSYIRIYDDWFRDQNLVAAEVPQITDASGHGASSLNFANTNALYKSAKMHDYFTSALPYVQKGDVVSMSMVGDLAAAPTFRDLAGDVRGGALVASATGEQPAVQVTSPTGVWTVSDALYWDNPSLTLSVNALREAEAMQRLLERDARGGTRLPEQIRAHFGVDVPDFRIQRSEYLGGGRGMINVSPIANTSATATEDQGQMVGVGTGRLMASWAKSFVEHGYVIGLLRARGQISYQQGVDRMWSRSTRFDFLWPEFANLGEQPIYVKEIFNTNDANQELVFGYQERYADYRWKKSLVTGKFASEAAGSLDFWHLAEDFATTPSLNQVFIEDATPMARVTTVDTEPDFIIDGRFDLRVARVLPVRPVPSLVPPRF